ncbi:MAG TPA: uroporphyrinogen decarboxylase [Nitrososphaerales archaeon]|nr:uroporphyrinogen decarboxylase [Nitrososphaerales archaeon]
MTPRDRFLAACRKEEVDCTPVWFMRQAGRYLPGYRDIRREYSVLDVCKTPKVCEQVTLMPVKELGVDAAVMFADIMLPLEGMGVDFRIEENIGPMISNPVANVKDVERLHGFDPKKHVPFVLEAIRGVASTLKATTRNALVGFSGAPFTIASYLIEGQPSRDFTKTKKMMFDDREAWNLLMSKLTEMISDYLCEQIESGVDAVQLFDSWVGALASADYERYVAPFVRQIFERVHREHPETPKIHFGTNTFHLLRVMKEKAAGAEAFSIDWRIPIHEARQFLGGDVAIQGNLEPAVLLSQDRDGFIAERVRQVLDDNAGASGYIFNLGHGMLRSTPVENAKFAVEYVHSHTVS